ncbi:UNVERIFIED_CONTAM: hypothetical protein FKN15_004631 [Acipenser sinensis]
MSSFYRAGVPRIDDIQAHGLTMRRGRGEEEDGGAGPLEGRLAELRDMWSQLISEGEQRHGRLTEAHRAQQFYADAAEAEAWMGEQELHMMSDEKAKDEQSATAMVKRHQGVEQALEDYAQTIHQLANSSRLMVTGEHPESERITMRQAQVDKLYAGLKDLAEERRGKLQERLRLCQLKKEVDDLEQWISEREVVAGSHELGQDYEHVTMLRDKFREFARDTSAIGQERVDSVNALADELIDSGHPENATVAEWKDGLNDAPGLLLELIDTRTQMLSASYELHRFHQDAKETLGRIQEKSTQLPEELGRDLNTVQHLHRQHTTYEHDIQALSGQIREKLKQLDDKRDEINNKWQEKMGWLQIARGAGQEAPERRGRETEEATHTPSTRARGGTTHTGGGTGHRRWDSETESVNGPGRERDSVLAASSEPGARIEPLPSATLPSKVSEPSGGEQMEGMLCRKHEMESFSKKAASSVSPPTY